MTTAASTQEQTGLLALARTIRRRLGLVALATVLVPLAALAFSLSQTTEYSTSASLLFRDPQFDQKLFGSTVFTPNTDPTREAATNVKLVSLEVVAARTARKLDHGVTPSDVQGKVQVAAQGQSNVANITATDHNPTFAAKLANTFAQQFIDFRRDADRSKIASAQKLVQEQIRRLPPSQRTGTQGSTLRQRGEQLQVLAALQTGNAELVQPADVPSSPSSPNPVRNTLLGLIVGILLGLGLAVLLERLDRRLKDPKEISEAFDRPILGAIPESRAIATADHDPQRLAPGEAESFRMLRANLRYFNVDHRIDSVLITSSAPADGKSTVAMHLAVAAASAGARVLLMEADLRHPTLARRLGIPADTGLSQVLADQAPNLRAVSYALPITGRREGDPGYRTLDVVLAGPVPPNPTDLIESERMRDLIRTAERDYDLVVIDTPPTSVVSDAIPLVKEVSGVIVVCRLGKTTRESVSQLRHQLENLEANTLGVVINSVGRQSQYYGYGYGYGYDYSTGAEQASANGATHEVESRAARRRPRRETDASVEAQSSDVNTSTVTVPEEEPDRNAPGNGRGSIFGTIPETPASPQPSSGRRPRRLRKNRRQPPPSS